MTEIRDHQVQRRLSGSNEFAAVDFLPPNLTENQAVASFHQLIEDSRIDTKYMAWFGLRVQNLETGEIIRQWSRKNPITGLTAKDTEAASQLDIIMLDLTECLELQGEINQQFIKLAKGDLKDLNLMLARVADKVQKLADLLP